MVNGVDVVIPPQFVVNVVQTPSDGTGFSVLAGATSFVVNIDSPGDGNDFVGQEYTIEEKTKLIGIETGATADQTGAEIKTLYELEADTNAYDDAAVTKLGAIEAAATADQTGAQIKVAYEAELDTNAYDDAAVAKLAAIEASATADQTGAEIKTAYELETNAYTDTKDTKLTGIETAATADQTDAEIRTAVEAATDSNVFTDADHTKLNAIEASATADQTDAEIRTAVEAATDSNVFTDADHSKLDAIEALATADQSNAEIKTAYELNANTNAYSDAEQLKLLNIEVTADITDATNVDAAGAVMDSDISAAEGFIRKTGAGTYVGVKSNLGAAVAPTVNEDSGDGYAIGSIWIDTTANKVYQATDVTVAAAVWKVLDGISDIVEDVTPQLGANLDTQTFTVDGRNVSVDGTKLDTIETSATADQSDAEIETAYNAQVAQISGAEITAGTETAIRRVSPADLQAVVDNDNLSPVLTTPQINDTTADHQYLFGVSELVADRTITLPLLTGNDTFLFEAFAATLTNKVLGAGCSVTSPLVTFESTGIDDNATQTALTIDSSERILTGTTVPDLLGADAGSMTVSTGNSGRTTANTWGDDFIIEGLVNTGMTISTPNTVSGNIFFADPEGNQQGSIKYSHVDDELTFRANNTVSLFIDSTGRIVTGGTTVDVFGAERGSMTISTGNSAVTSANASSDDLVIENNSGVGISLLSPNTLSGNIMFGDPEDNNMGRIQYSHSGNVMHFYVNGNATAALSLNSTTGGTGGTGSAGAGNKYVEMKINNVRYKLLHDGVL